MGVDLLYYAYVAVVLLTVARYFLAKKGGPKNIGADDQPTTLASRGSFINYVIGAHRVGPGFGWADDDGIITRRVGGGGKGFGGGGSAGQTIYSMAGWHILCPGPVTSLDGIWENGKQVYFERLDRDTTPSGTTVNAGDIGSFKIYWGEFDQPICEELAAKIGVRSRWPGVCYIYWLPKKLGNSPLWPQEEYKIETAFACVGTLNTPYMLDNGTSRGVNPAHVLAQVLTGKFPYGHGMPPSLLDKISLTEFSELMADEHLPMNIKVQDGDTGDKIIAAVLSEAGVMMPDHRGKLYFSPVRRLSGDDPVPPELDEDVLVAPEPTIDTVFDEDASVRVIWTYKDEEFNYRDNDLPSDDDGVQTEFSAYNTEQVSLATITNKVVAAEVRARRDPEVFGNNGGVRMKVIHGANLLIPGFPFTTATGPMRLVSIKRSTTSAQADATAIIDSYAVSAPAIINNDTPGPLPSSTQPVPDLAFDFFELPFEVTGGVPKIAVLRIRGNQAVSGAIVWGSADGATYSPLGNQDSPAAGGPLTTPLSDATDDVIEDGPLFEAMNDDILTVRDLSSSISTWQSGQQIMVINGECFYLRNIEAMAVPERVAGDPYSLGDQVIPEPGQGTGLRYVCIQAGTALPGVFFDWPTVIGETVEDGGVIWEAHGFVYQPHGLIRARLGTSKQIHSEEDIVYIVQRSVIEPMSGAIIAPGINLCVKTQPTTFGRGVSLSGIDSMCRVITGIGTGKDFMSLDGNFVISHTGDILIYKGE